MIIQVWANYCDEAQIAIFFAQEECRATGYEHISSEHILLGILHHPTNVAGLIFENLSVPTESLRADIVKRLPRRPRPDKPNMQWSHRGRHLFDGVTSEARSFDPYVICTGHFLLALCHRRWSKMGRLLAKYGVQYKAVRQEMSSMVSRGMISRLAMATKEDEA